VPSYAAPSGRRRLAHGCPWGGRNTAPTTVRFWVGVAADLSPFHSTAPVLPARVAPRLAPSRDHLILYQECSH
jgi:hypothetical protein